MPYTPARSLRGRTCTRATTRAWSTETRPKWCPIGSGRRTRCASASKSGHTARSRATIARTASD
eukprot:918023-Prymnesium_polylepis.3